MTIAINQLDFGHFSIDFTREVVIRDGQSIALRPQSFRVLQHLVEHRGQVVKKQALFDAVWGDTVVTDDSLTQCLVEIRKALGPEGRKLVRTLSRRGYIFEGTPTEIPAAPTARHSGRYYLAGLFAGLLLLVGGSLFYLRTEDAVPTLAPVDTRQSNVVVAVLPFADFTEGGESDYLGYGVAEENMNRLTLIPGPLLIFQLSM